MLHAFIDEVNIILAKLTINKWEQEAQFYLKV
jgi:hypothetical protein